MTLAARAPFRLDLTVAALQRLPANPVDVWRDGRYVRVFETSAGPVGWSISSRARAPGVTLRLYGAVVDPGPWIARARRILGLDIDLDAFYARAGRVPALTALVETLRGLKPPRYPSLWEAIANAVPFQQVSLAAGLATVRRLVAALTAPTRVDDVVVHPFPAPDAVAELPEARLRAIGLSGTKARALRALAEEIATGSLREDDLEPLSTAHAAERLVGLPGIGPWTAAVLLLRGLRRLDAFPGGDSGVRRNVRELLGEDVAIERLLAQLGATRGMLYYHLLLGGLAHRTPGDATAR